MLFGSLFLWPPTSAVFPYTTLFGSVVVVWLTHAVQPSAVRAMVGPTTPLVVLKLVPKFVVYFTESAKYASSAVTRFRRSDFIEARYAFSFVLANFGIAMAAKIPMITTTMRSSIRVKPLRFIVSSPSRAGKCRGILNTNHQHRACGMPRATSAG